MKADQKKKKNSLGKATPKIVWLHITLFHIGMTLLTSERFRISTEMFFSVGNCSV